MNFARFLASLSAVSTLSLGVFACHPGFEAHWQAVLDAQNKTSADSAELLSSYGALSADDASDPALARLGLVTGASDGLDATSAKFDGNGDIGFMVNAVMMLSSQEAAEDLRRLVDEMKALTDKKKALRELAERARKDQIELKGALGSEFEHLVASVKPSATPRPTASPPPIIIDMRVLVTGAGEASVPFAADAGDVKVAVDCGQARNEFTLELTDLSTGLSLGKVTAIGTANVATKISGKAALRTRVGGAVNAGWITNTCTIRMSFVSTGTTTTPISKASLPILERAAGDFAQQTSDLAAELDNLRRQQTIDPAVLDIFIQAATRLQSRVALIVAAAGLGKFDDATKDAVDTLGDMTQFTQLRMQTAVAERGKVFEILSILLKKISDTAGTIVANMK